MDHVQIWGRPINLCAEGLAQPKRELALELRDRAHGGAGTDDNRGVVLAPQGLQRSDELSPEPGTAAFASGTKRLQVPGRVHRVRAGRVDEPRQGLGRGTHDAEL